MQQTALITGASKRIGRSLAIHLAERGWNVAIHFNSSAKPANDLVSELSERFPGQIFKSFRANLADINEVFTLVPSVIDIFGPFQLLVNNASVFDPGFIDETSAELFDKEININLRAPFFLMRDFSKLCKAGIIVNFVDTRITTNRSNFAAYSLSKKGLWEMTKMAALEFAPSIRVNGIAPGVTLAPEDKDETYLGNLAKSIPMKRPGGLDPIISSIDYIIENQHLTGQLLFADGGENLG